MSMINFFKRNKDDIIIPADNDFFNKVNKDQLKQLFIRAVQSNDVVGAKDLIDNFNAPVNITYENVSILSMCLSQRKFALAKHLILHGADTSDVLTPKVYRKLVECQDIQLIDFYKEYLNLDINGVNDLGETLLTTAILQNKSKVIDYLLKFDTLDLNQKNMSNLTPLDVALDLGNYDLAKNLIYKGATLTECDICILDFALQNNDFEFVKYLNEHDMLKNVILEKLDLFFEKSITENNLEFVRYFISCGADVNTLLKNDNTPLILATKQDNIKLIQLLLNAKADIDQKNLAGKSPLIFAMEKHELSMIKYLVAMKANVNIQDANGNTPLMIATIQQDAHLVKHLLDAGANVCMQNNDLNSPLDIAVQIGDASIINDLLSKDINAVKKFSPNILHLAVKQNNFTSLMCLVKHNLPIDNLDDQKNTPLLLALKLNNIPFVKHLLDNKASVNIYNIDGDSPLVLAIKSQNLDLIKEFIDKGADVNVLDKNQLSPLAYAFKSENINIINHLIHTNAIIDTEYVINGKKTTPLIEAIKMGSNTLVKELIACGANVNFKTSDAISPLFVAKKYKKHTIWYHLITNGAKGSFWEKIFGKILLLSNRFKHKCFKIKTSYVPRFVKKYVFRKNDAIDLNKPKAKTINL